MLKNYLITTLRKLNRQKNYTFINVLGLALGLACCLFIFLIIQYELRFDRFHQKYDRIYRVVTDEKINDLVSPTMGTPIPMAQALRHDFPNLEKVAAIFGMYGGLFSITREDNTTHRFQENDRVAFVEPEFFEIFDFPWLAGDPKSLAEPNVVALTAATAKKFFGAADPLGRTIRMDNQTDLKVIGILKDLPIHTDFPFNVFISWESVPLTGMPMDSWTNLSSNVNTYVLFALNDSPPVLEKQLVDFKNKYHPEAQDANKRLHKLQPLSAVHYDGRYGNFSQRATAKTTLWALGLIGVFLLITACINFINMATAQAINRAREVGVRKVLGARRSQLIVQYLGEALIITLLGAACAVVLAELLLPNLNDMLRLQINFHPFSDLSLFLFLLSLASAVGLLAGLYPAFVLSQFMPALALKSKVRASSGGLSLRRGLVIFQFVISQLLIIGTIIVTRQMDYFRNKEMGFDQNAIVVVPLPANEAPQLQTLRNQLLQNSQIKNVTFGWASAASGNVWDTNLRHALRGQEETFAADLKFADAEYIPTYNLKLIAGRNYTASDTTTELVVNETFAQKLGFAPQDMIGKTFKLGRRPYYLPIVGVVQDFHARPLQEGIRPCLLAARRTAYQEASIKLNAQNVKDAMTHIEKVWSTTFPEFVYSFEFLDQRIAGFYQQEQLMSQLFRAFSAIAIFIGCIGLLGLISFMAAQRTKEIGVRKVLGATVGSILSLFLKEFVALIAVAFIVAAPLAYFTMNNWLTNFAYRINIGAGVFLLTMAITLLIAVLTVGYRATRAALANPVEALRYE
jgi:ABC-type antimicrobial peptide transport system permease subunit